MLSNALANSWNVQLYICFARYGKAVHSWEDTISELLSTFLYQKYTNTGLISLKTTLSRYVVLYSISSESGNMPDTWKYRKERYWTSFRIDILLASIQHRKSWYLHHNQDENCHHLHDEYLLKCRRLYYRFELVPNEVNGRLMKHLFVLQETAWLVFLLEKAMSLLTPSDKPALHLVLPDSSRSNDDNPQFTTMHIIHSSRSQRHYQSY